MKDHTKMMQEYRTHKNFNSIWVAYFFGIFLTCVLPFAIPIYMLFYGVDRFLVGMPAVMLSFTTAMLISVPLSAILAGRWSTKQTIMRLEGSRDE